MPLREEETSFKDGVSWYKPPPYFLNIKSIPVRPLLWMNAILDFCMVFAVLWATGSKWKIQNENIWLDRESNQAFPLLAIV